MHRARHRIDMLDAPGDQHLGAEPPRLPQRPARQFVARNAVGKAQIVLDPRRGAGLSARSFPLDHHGTQPLGRAIHRRRQPRRATADDDGVVLGGAGDGLQPQQPGQFARLGPDQRRAVGQLQRRQFTLRRRRALPAAAEFLGIRCEAVEGDLVTGEEPPQRQAGRVPALPDDGHLRPSRFGRDPLQPADPLARQVAHLLDHIGRSGGDGVILPRRQPQQP